MRALFEDAYFDDVSPASGVTGSVETDGSPGEELFVIHKVNWSAASPRCDLWFAVVKSGAGQPIEIRAYATLEGARSDDGINYIASAEITHTDLPDSFMDQTDLVLTNNVATNPTIEASITVYGSQGNTGSLAGVIAYTAAPDLYCCDAIREEILELAAVPGSALAKVVSQGAVRVGHPDAAHVFPYIAIHTGPWELEEELSTGSIAAARYMISIDVMCHVLDDDADPGTPSQASWRECRSFQAIIESMLFDERRTFRGAAFQVVGFEGDSPEPVENLLAYQATVTFSVQFLKVWPERREL